MNNGVPKTYKFLKSATFFFFSLPIPEKAWKFPNLLDILFSEEYSLNTLVFWSVSCLPFHFLSVLVLHSVISISSRIHNTYLFSILFSHFVFSFLQKMHWKRVCYENNGSHDAHTVSITMLLPVYGSFNKLTSLACYLFI